MFTLKEKIFLAITTIFFVAITYLTHYYLESFNEDLRAKSFKNLAKEELDL
jgi:hypothetical protein